jgi:hypothetical protein
MFVLPPVIDASFGPDSAETRDRIKFPCGTVTGAVTANLVCERLFPDLNWDFEPSYAFLSISASIAAGAEGPDSAVSTLTAQGLVFQILTQPPTAPMTVSCATVPPLPPHVWGPAFHGGFGAWSAACDSPTEALPGSSFELTITSVGVLTSDSLGSDPLDASADGFDWDAAHGEVLSNTFHGTFKATLVAGDAGAPVHVSMTF